MTADNKTTTPEEAQTTLRQQRTELETLQMMPVGHSSMQADMALNVLLVLPEVLQTQPGTMQTLSDNLQVRHVPCWGSALIAECSKVASLVQGDTCMI